MGCGGGGCWWCRSFCFSRISIRHITYCQLYLCGRSYHVWKSIIICWDNASMYFGRWVTHPGAGSPTVGGSDLEKLAIRRHLVCQLRHLCRLSFDPITCFHLVNTVRLNWLFSFLWVYSRLVLSFKVTPAYDQFLKIIWSQGNRIMHWQHTCSNDLKKKNCDSQPDRDQLIFGSILQDHSLVTL